MGGLIFGLDGFDFLGGIAVGVGLPVFHLAVLPGEDGVDGAVGVHLGQAQADRIVGRDYQSVLDHVGFRFGKGLQALVVVVIDLAGLVNHFGEGAVGLQRSLVASLSSTELMLVRMLE